MTDELSKGQREALDRFRTTKILTITGPPGSGKTRLIRELTEAEPDSVLLAPTGCAAERVTQSTGKRTFTVDHAMHNVQEFKRKRLIVDEAGMVSTNALSSVYRFLEPESVTLIGDPKQLPCPMGLPVLSGLLRLSDVVPHVELTETFRLKERGTALDHAIRDLGTDKTTAFVEDDTFRVYGFDTYEEAYRAAATDFEKRPSQALCYTNEGTKEMNRLTENPKAKIVRGSVRDGDRVVCTQNVYDKGTLMVANGTCGTVDSKKGVEYDNGYKDSKLNTKFVSCRCMTVHKAQGNEFDRHGIVVLAPWKGTPPLELMYTALSRFKRSAAVYGPKTVLRAVFASKFSDVVDESLVLGVRESFERRKSSSCV